MIINGSGMAARGTVAHLVKGVGTFGLPVSFCGRWVIAGETTARLCKTCARITGMEITEAVRTLPTTSESAQKLIDGCKCASTHKGVDDMLKARHSGFARSMFRDVLSEWENGADNADCTIGLYSLILMDNKLIADGPKADLTITKGGKGDHSTVSKGKPAHSNGISEAQRNFIESLQNQFDEMEELINGDKAVSCKIFTPEEIAAFDKKRASKLIETLKGQIDKLRPAANAARNSKRAEETKANPAEDGFYVMGDTWVTVKWNRSKTGQYATVWSHETESWEWDGRESYRLLKMVKAGELARVTEADAMRFGELYGRCMRCSKTLTDPDSILASMGSTCRGKMGF